MASLRLAAIHVDKKWKPIFKQIPACGDSSDDSAVSLTWRAEKPRNFAKFYDVLGRYAGRVCFLKMYINIFGISGIDSY